MKFLLTLLKCLFCWRFKPASDEELSSADAVVTQSYGRHKDGTAGVGNVVMAAIAKQLHEKYRLPVIPQEELVMADPTLPYYDIAGGSKDGKSTVNWNTYEVAKLQANTCKKNGWKKMIVIVSAAWSWKSCLVLQKAGAGPGIGANAFRRLLSS